MSKLMARAKLFMDNKYTRKLLFLSAFLPLLSCNTPKVHAFPRNNSSPNMRNKKQSYRTPALSATCKFSGKSFEYRLSDGTIKVLDNLLKPRERVLETKCNDGYAFVLTRATRKIKGKPVTEMGLITITGKNNSQSNLTLQRTRKNMTRTLKPGYVAFAAREDGTSFFLMRDGGIAEIPLIIPENRKNLDAHSIPFKVAGAKMRFHSGLLFIAPVEGKMVVMKITDKARYVDRALPDNSTNGEFFFIGSRLFFGTKANASEIMVNGPNPSDVKLNKK